ncbi:MAG: hypothetical protein EBS23_00625 [Betaproteobacteria bacterium]|nr:hypothetical protein [Betaproteobacteria bacterium]
MELFSPYETDSILDHRMTARVPFGVILREMIALETRGTEKLPIAALSRDRNPERADRHRSHSP